MADENGEWSIRNIPKWMDPNDIPEWMTDSEKEFKAGGKKIQPVAFRQTYNVDQYIIDMLGDEPFFAAMMMQMQKVMTLSIPTMAVTFARDQFTLLINPEFVEKLHVKNRKADIHSVLMHECLHPCNDHLTIRWKSGRHKKAWGWATDMEINSMLTKKMKRTLPGSPIIPGLRPGMPFDIKADPPKPENREAFNAWVASAPTPLQFAVMSAPQEQAAEFYYDLIYQHMKDEDDSGKSSSGPDGEDPGTDDHDVWGDPSDEGETPEYLAERTKDLLRNAAEQADKKRNWGSVPAEMQESIRKLLKGKVDWRDELAQWFGMQYVNIDKHSSVRRVNKKYPYEQPGKRRGQGIHVMVACDQSGSVDDNMLSLLGNELVSLVDVAKITFVPFDTIVAKNAIQEWEPGTTPSFSRVRTGGTDFTPVTEFANSDENRGQFDMMIVLTDGGAGKPVASRIPRLWVLPEGCDLAFTTDEKRIFIPTVA